MIFYAFSGGLPQIGRYCLRTIGEEHSAGHGSGRTDENVRASRPDHDRGSPNSTASLRPFPHAGDGLGEELHLFTVGLVILEGHHPGKPLVTQYS